VPREQIRRRNGVPVIRLIVKAVLALAMLAYLGVGGYLYARQQSLLYHPQSKRFLAAELGLQGFEDVTIKTSDGETLVAYYKPASAGQPTFLYFHGNSDRPNSRQERKTLLTEDGRGLLYLCYRGFSGSTGAPSEAGLRRDAEAAYAWLSARVPAQSIVLYGESLGTGVAVELAGRVEVKAVVLDAPYTSTADVALLKYPFLPVHWLMQDQYPSLERISRLKAPLLVLHGTQDRMVPYEMGQRLFQAATVPKTFVTIPEGDHTHNLERAIAPLSHFLITLSAR
jgi:fermentation-respiration switch protein FrsA (DUF1100 family)